MRRFIRTLMVLTTSAAMAAAMTMLASGVAHASQTGEVDFTVPGTWQWTAPAGVDAAQIVVRGAAGGNNVSLDGTTSSGGNGALVQGSFPLVAGQTYSIVVGQLGGSATDATTDAAGGLGGYGGGGDGVSAGGGCHPSGGGGGATSFSAVGSGTPLVVAGGGGGARSGVTGGAGNYPVGDPGPSVFGNPADAAGGGRQDTGGIPGFDAATGSYDFAHHGVALYGGTGGSDNCTGGGGGGGGWFGGGGGSGANSGGGGSSYVSPSVDVYNATASSIRTSGAVNLFYGTAVAPSPIVSPALHLTAGEAVGTQYSAAGWPQPLIVATGAVPDGVTIGSDGSVTGAPTKAGTFSVTINAYNVAGLTSWVQEIDVVPGSATKVAVLPTSDSTAVGTLFTHDPVAHVTDQYGNAVAGSSVLFIDLDGLVTFESADPGSPSAISVVTDAGGNADAGRVLAGATPGVAKVEARVGKIGASAQYTVGNPATLTVASTSVKEGNTGTKARKITVTLSQPVGSKVTVRWTTVDGSATAGSDYVAKSGTIKFIAGQVTATITVQIIGDTVGESTETFLIALTNAKHATIGTPYATQTIVDDDIAHP